MNDLAYGFLMTVGYWALGGLLFWVCVTIVDHIYPENGNGKTKFERGNHHV